MSKIKKLSIANILESAAVHEATEGSSKIISASLGAAIELKKDDGTSSLFIAVSAAGPSKYKKVEDKDLEFPILRNELAGVVGDFDSKVQALMASYGYEWVNPADNTSNDDADNLLESKVNEDGGNPQGSWIGDFFVSNVISISKFVDAAVEQYDFGDEQEVENKFRAKIKEIMKELVGEMYEPENDSPEAITDCVTSILADMNDELQEFEDYR